MRGSESSHPSRGEDRYAQSGQLRQPFVQDVEEGTNRIEEKDQSVETHVASRLDAMELTCTYILGANGRFESATGAGY